MKIGMIAVLAAATLAATDDTSRVVGSVVRFAARVSGVTDATVNPSHRRHAPRSLVSSRCVEHHARSHATASLRRVANTAGRTVNDSLLEALRAGGLVIVFRHALTDRSQSDARPLSLTDRAAQRNLSAAGVEQATRIGERIRLLRVPVDEVYASPLFRAMDTATNAFGRAEASEALRSTPLDSDRARLLSEPPPAGTNRVLVTHNFVLVAMFRGMRPGDLREGDAMIVRPLGGGKFDVVGQIRAEDWARLGGRGPVDSDFTVRPTVSPGRAARLQSEV